MAYELKINKHELLQAIEAILRECDLDEFVLRQDFYWFIQRPDAYEPRGHPRDLTLGQLSHDWERLQSIAKNESAPLPYALVWAAGLLRAIGEGQ